MEKSSKKVPRTPLQFYVQLYCKRKGKSDTKNKNNTLVEATKSWLSLTNEERQQIIEKHRECIHKYNKTLADYLKNAEPFLKRKKNRKSCMSNEVNTATIHLEKETVQSTLQETANLDVASITEDIANDTSPKADEELREQQQQSTVEKQVIKSNLLEPNPPNVRNARQLFETIQVTEEDPGRNWLMLSKAEKRRYQQAVLMLKKDYINKYKEYLESLSSKELFNYYSKNMN